MTDRAAAANRHLARVAQQADGAPNADLELEVIGEVIRQLDLLRKANGQGAAVRALAYAQSFLDVPGHGSGA